MTPFSRTSTSRPVSHRLAVGLVCLAMSACLPAHAEQPIVIGFITKVESNPYFRKMREGLMLGATVHGIQVTVAAAANDTDSATQIDALRTMVAAGVRTILIAPTGDDVVPAILQARAQGTQVIALDSPTKPADAVDALFGTNNHEAGLAIGRYAKAAMAQKFPGQPLRIITLDHFPGSPVGAQRHNGFMTGLGMQADGAESVQLSTAPEIVCMADSFADTAKGRIAMASCLAKQPDFNLLYTINEPAAAGAYEALKAAGKEKNVMIVSFDGGCPGIRDVESRKIAATAQQFPLKMAAMGVDAGVAYAKRGTKVKGYVDTGLAVITTEPMPGLPNKSVAAGLESCFGPK